VPTCSSCGHENREGAKFCEECGGPLPVAPAPREQRKVVTVLFCDVTGSTSLGERLDPEPLRALLARYFEGMKVIVERHGGTVEKFIGDAIMAVFGVPVLHEDDALRAVRAAGEMRDALPALGIEGRIGVTTGEVVTGTAERLATGEAVNVAARLEQAAGPGQVLLGAGTLRLVRDVVEVEAVEPLELKGKSEPMSAYRLLAVTGEPVRRHDAPMVGRARQRRQLQEAFAAVRADRACHLFTILGVAGVGKSRLAAEFLSALEATVVRGRCLSYGDGITYWPVIEVVKQLASRPEDERAAAVVRSLLAESAETVTADDIAWAVRKALEREAGERPLVVVWDDLHWAEPACLDLVEHVADLSRDAPILLLCLARPELLDRRPGWAGGKLNATTALLEPLSAEETDELIEGLGAVDESLRARIRDAAEGNPLFVEEMLALVRDGDGDVVVPPTIQALLAARLDQLDPPERAVLERGAVEGKVFHRGAVEALAPKEGNVSQRLIALIRKELVRPDRPLIMGEDAFRFRHLLIRDAAYDALPKSVRAELHERFAAWLEQHGAALVELDEILGYHLEKAYRYRTEVAPSDEETQRLGQQAAARLISAGQKASAREDMRAAANLFNRAERLLETDDPVRLQVLLDLAGALAVVGELGRAHELLDEAVSGARGASDRRVELHAVIDRELLRVLTNPEGMLARIPAIADEAIRVFEELGDERGIAKAWKLLHEVGWFECRFGDSAEALDRALEHIARTNDRREEAELRARLINALGAGPMPVDEALPRCEAILVEAGGGPLTEASLLGQIALQSAFQGNIMRARELSQRSEAMLEEFGVLVGVARSKNQRAKIEILAGDPAVAEQKWRESCDIFLAIGERTFLSTRAAELAEKALYALGKYDEAERYAELGREAGSSDDIETQARWRGARAKVLARRGEFGAAEALAREAIELAENTDFPELRGDVLIDAAEVLRLAGGLDEAASFAQRALEAYRRKGIIPSAGEAKAFLERLHAGAS
jgi:class 3 adenylate cyclase/tetratricopeptide (TPR) repeat protein